MYVDVFLYMWISVQMSCYLVNNVSICVVVLCVIRKLVVSVCFVACAGFLNVEYNTLLLLII